MVVGMWWWVEGWWECGSRTNFPEYGIDASLELLTFFFPTSHTVLCLFRRIRYLQMTAMPMRESSLGFFGFFVRRVYHRGRKGADIDRYPSHECRSTC